MNKNCLHIYIKKIYYAYVIIDNLLYQREREHIPQISSKKRTGKRRTKATIWSFCDGIFTFCFKFVQRLNSRGASAYLYCDDDHLFACLFVWFFFCFFVLSFSFFFSCENNWEKHVVVYRQGEELGRGPLSQKKKKTTICHWIENLPILRVHILLSSFSVLYVLCYPQLAYSKLWLLTWGPRRIKILIPPQYIN